MLVFALIAGFIVAWTLVYVFVVRPKLESYRATAGIYAALDAWEGALWQRTVLQLKGLKVAIVGAITSSAPVIAVAWDHLSEAATDGSKSGTLAVYDGDHRFATHIDGTYNAKGFSLTHTASGETIHYAAPKT